MTVLRPRVPWTRSSQRRHQRLIVEILPDLLVKGALSKPGRDAGYCREVTANGMARCVC